MAFADRTEAAELLSKKLVAYKGKRSVVLAIPRGAIKMGRVIADMLGCELDVVLVRKLRAPRQPELAVGSIDENGWTYLAPQMPFTGVTDTYIEAEKQFQLNVLKQRRALYTPGRSPIELTGRVAIVIDDGLATGATMLAALHAVRARNPDVLVCAVPVAAPDSLELVRPYTDTIVCLQAPAEFYAVGQFYRSFPQVSDDEAIQALSGS